MRGHKSKFRVPRGGQRIPDSDSARNLLQVLFLILVHKKHISQARVGDHFRAVWNSFFGDRGRVNDPDPKDKSNVIHGLGVPGANTRVSRVLARFHTNPYLGPRPRT
jgi:hypothetical protein